MDRDIMDFAERKYSDGNPEVIDRKLLSNHGRICTDNKPSNQDIQALYSPSITNRFTDKFHELGLENEMSIFSEQTIQNTYHTSEETAAVNAEKNSNTLLCDYGSICFNNQPSNQYIYGNPEKICHIPNSNTTISKEKQVLNNIPSVSGFSNYTERQIPIYDRVQNFESIETGCHTHISSIPRNHLAHNDMIMDNTANIHNRKRIASNYAMVVDDSLPPKIIRDETREMSGQLSGSCKDVGGMTSDLWMTNSMTNQVPFKDNCLVNIDHQFQSGTCSNKGDPNSGMWLAKSMTNQMTYPHKNFDNVDHKFHTIKEPPTHNRRMLSHGTPGKEAHLNFTQTTASNSGIPEITQKDYRMSTISDSMVSEKETAYCGENIVAIPGPSGSHINENEVYASGEMSNVKLKKEKALACEVCKEEISKHESKQRKHVFYECCICAYNAYKQVELQMHSNTHYPKQFCNKCEKYHKEGKSHDGEHPCSLCEKRVQCRTKLQEHYLEHQDYFETHCRLCCGFINYHFIEKEDHFVCCICGQRTNLKKNFRKHKYRHFNKNVCKICTEEYPKEEQELHNSEFECFVCEKKFRCKTQLEEHSEDSDEYCFEYCKLCKKEMTEHVIKKKGGRFFRCCRCLLEYRKHSRLPMHLLTHTDLRLFKCYACGRRFQTIMARVGHLTSCPELPHKCNICKKRFPRRDFLVAHYSVRHNSEW